MAFKCVQRPGEREEDINNSGINSSSEYKYPEMDGERKGAIVLFYLND